jgi:hypothetical protein
VLFCVMCVVLWLCLIVAPLPPGINPFAVNNNNNNDSYCFGTPGTVCSVLVDISQWLVEHEISVKGLCTIPETACTPAGLRLRASHDTNVANSFFCQIFSFHSSLFARHVYCVNITLTSCIFISIPSTIVTY